MFYFLTILLTFMAGLHFYTHHKAAIIYMVLALIVYMLAILTACECPMNDD